MRGEYTELPCPFCDKGVIKCWYIPSMWGEKHSGRGSLGSGRRVTKSSEEWMIQSGCSVCGKSQEDVEKELKRKGTI